MDQQQQQSGMRARCRWRAFARRLLLLAVLGPFTGNAAQGLGGTQKGFKAAEFFPAPHDLQMQSLLQAARVQPFSEKRFLLSDLVLRSFRQTGEPELLVKAPQCLYEVEPKLARSPGPLQVTTADGKFSIEGEGFSLQQTNASLTISNQVLTRIDPALLSPDTNKVPRKSSSPGLEIRAGLFEYSGETGLGVYQRNVRVTGSNDMSLTTEKLSFELPFKERQLKTLQADGKVVVDRGGVHATSETALYSAATGLIHLRGEPAWRNEQRQGRGDELIIDRTNKVFRSEGKAWVRMPAQGLSISGLLTQTNAVAGAPKSTNQFVEVSSAYHEFRTNHAVFGDQVILTERLDDQPRGTLTCDLLNVRYTGSNQLETLVAERNVVMKEGTNALSGGKAVLNGTNGVLQVTENPAWLSGDRSGKGELIRVETRTKEMLVRGRASMRLPSGELSQAADPRSRPQERKPVAGATNDWAEVFADEYTLNEQGVQFRGHVHAQHPQMNWTCETLTVRLPPSGGQVESILAERGVLFELTDEKGKKVRGRGDKAVYTYAVASGVTNDLIELTGSPAVLESDQATNRNKIIILDRAHQKLITPGDYRILTAPLKGRSTNALELPNLKVTK